jgi:uncharacterized protein
MRAQCLVVLALSALAPVQAADNATPLVIGDTFTVQSKALNEARGINVYLPPGYAAAARDRVAVSHYG